MNDKDHKGLSDVEVELSREQNGSNLISEITGGAFFQTLWDVVKEPMFVLLLITAGIYFFVGQTREGVIMTVSLLLVAGISFYQERRSRKAIDTLRKISSSKTEVCRNGEWVTLFVDELVVGDLVHIVEGEVIPSDCTIVSCNDFSVDESVLTGESVPVQKNNSDHKDLFKGTLVISGSGEALVTAVGIKTAFGKIAKSLAEVTEEKTPLQQQIGNFVKYMVWVGGMAFLIIVAIQYQNTHDLLQAFLSGLTLAMSILPEEIPVAFSTFQALGAFRLLKKNRIIVKKSHFVETLGSATVICVDKTGTITQNKMTLEFLFDENSGEVYDLRKDNIQSSLLIEYAMWSSEENPFDPMEKAIHELYGKVAEKDKRIGYHLVHEYPLSGVPPMMTHVFSGSGDEPIIAAKGGVEAILSLSQLNTDERTSIKNRSDAYAAMGYRVLAVGKGKWSNVKWPDTQQGFKFDFLGLLVFQDPPKFNISNTLENFKKAGINVKMITGDHPQTALAISRQTGLTGNVNVITGAEVMEMSKEELRVKVTESDVFARMFPDAKLKVVEALKENGEVVAMTGDGVNDAPALKAAHIGIAMGKKGTEVAKDAASLILTDDDLSHMVDAVAMGRKIYNNLKKAVQYIVAIHIPIILIVTLPLLLSWKFDDIFSPVHVVFLELIMGPTCSIIYENEPMEEGLMLLPPLKKQSTFLSFHQLFRSLIQGMVITAGCLLLGYCYMIRGAEIEVVRAVVFITMLFSNIFLTFIMRSSKQLMWHSPGNGNWLISIVVAITLVFIFLCLYVPAVTHVFELTSLDWKSLLYCFLAAMASTGWMEAIKFIKLQRNKKND